MIKSLILIPLLCLLLCPIIAQEVETEQTHIYKLGDFKKTTILGHANNQVIILLDHSEKQRLIIFDSTLQKSKSINFRLSSRIQKLATYIENDTICKLFFEKHKGLASLTCLRLDLDLRPIDTTVLYQEKYNYFFDSYYSFSEIESPKICLYRINSTKSIDILGVSKSDMRVSDTASIQLENFSSEHTELHGDINQNGDILIAFSRNYLSFKKAYSRWIAYKLSNGNTKRYEIELKGKLNISSEIKYDEINQNLVIAGYYGNKSIESANGIYRILVPFNRPTEDAKFNPFSTQVASEMSEKKNFTKKYIPNLVTRELVLRSDGGIIIIGEIEKITAYRSDISMTGVALKSSYNYAILNLLISSFNASFDSEWNQVVFKRQLSHSDMAMYSSYFLVHSRTQLNILVNDDVSKNNTISQYKLSPVGKMTRSHFLPLGIESPNFRVRDAFQSDLKHLYIIDHLKGRRFRLVGLRL